MVFNPISIFITIMESQSYKTFISEFKWISKWEMWPLQCDQCFHNDLIFFLSFFITFRTNVRMSITPFPCSIFFALYLEWSLNLSTDKKSNTICIFENLRYTLFGLWFKFSSAWFCFLSKCTQERAKANQEKFKCS